MTNFCGVNFVRTIIKKDEITYDYIKNIVQNYGTKYLTCKVFISSKQEVEEVYEEEVNKNYLTIIKIQVESWKEMLSLEVALNTEFVLIGELKFIKQATCWLKSMGYAIHSENNDSSILINKQDEKDRIEKKKARKEKETERREYNEYINTNFETVFWTSSDRNADAGW